MGRMGLMGLIWILVMFAASASAADMQALAHESAERMKVLDQASEAAAARTDALLAEELADLDQARRAVAEMRGLTLEGLSKIEKQEAWLEEFRAQCRRDLAAGREAFKETYPHPDDVLVLEAERLALSVRKKAATQRARSWTGGDTALQVTYAVLHAADWAQTLHIARDASRHNNLTTFTPLPGGYVFAERPYHEEASSWILGRNPSKGRVNMYFASTLALHTYVAYKLPKPWRMVWQSFWIGVEAGYVKRNVELGLRVSF